MANDIPAPTPQPTPEEHGSSSSPNPEPANPAQAETPDAQPAGDEKAELAALAQTGNTNRLSPADEDRATRLIRNLPARRRRRTRRRARRDAATAVDPRRSRHRKCVQELSADARAAVLDGLTKMDTDNGYRLRLSMARSLARMDLGEAAKVAAATCRSMWDTQNGSLKPEHSKLIGNVFIGRGKPWVLQLQLADLPAEDANAVLSAVVFSTFNVNNAPITQLSVLRYAGSRLAALHENLIGMVARAVGRWSGKWQSALRKEVADLPEAILSALQAGRAAESRAESAPESRGAAEETEAPVPAELQEKLRLAAESGEPAAVEAVNQEIAAWRETEKIARLEALDADEDGEDDEDDEEDEEDGVHAADTSDEGGGRRRRGRNDRKERPAYVSRDQERGQAGFSFSATLKQLESYVAGLRTDLAAAQSRLRRAESEGGKARADRPVLSHEEANLSPDELRRLVIQLEGRVEELKGRVEELTSDSEARALAMAAGTTDAATRRRDPAPHAPRAEIAGRLRRLSHAPKESPDAIVQQHYRGLISHVFEILRGEQVPLSVPSEPVVAPPLPPAVAP